MANPRKFSEKIALHNQKQAEETAAFEAIMREVVSDILCTKFKRISDLNNPQACVVGDGGGDVKLLIPSSACLVVAVAIKC